MQQKDRHHDYYTSLAKHLIHATKCLKYLNYKHTTFCNSCPWVIPRYEKLYGNIVNKLFNEFLGIN